MRVALQRNIFQRAIALMAGPRPGPEFDASYRLAVSVDSRLARFEPEDGGRRPTRAR
jgi:hypothetical protein